MTGNDASRLQSGSDNTPGIKPCPDLHILRNTILESISTSPSAFLATWYQLTTKLPEYWEEELRSSTWAVVQDRDEVLGIAAAKPPGWNDKHYADPARACFIESVWVAPSVRRKGIGRRLVTYLIEERRKAGIQQFYLWVFAHNTPAISLYQAMGFRPTGQIWTPLERQLCEIQYVLMFDRDMMDDERMKQNEDHRQFDRKRFRIIYRLLDSTGVVGY